MNFIPVELIFPTKVSKATGIKNFLKTYVLLWLNLSEKKYKVKHFFLNYLISPHLNPIERW